MLRSSVELVSRQLVASCQLGFLILFCYICIFFVRKIWWNTCKLAGTAKSTSTRKRRIYHLFLCAGIIKLIVYKTLDVTCVKGAFFYRRVCNLCNIKCRRCIITLWPYHIIVLTTKIGQRLEKLIRSVNITDRNTHLLIKPTPRWSLEGTWSPADLFYLDIYSATSLFIGHSSRFKYRWIGDTSFIIRRYVLCSLTVSLLEFLQGIFTTCRHGIMFLRL